MFCINAVKAGYCECKPVVRRVGGLQETVNKFIDFDELVGQKASKSRFTKKSVEENKKYVLQLFDMNKQMDKWRKILG